MSLFAGRDTAEQKIFGRLPFGRERIATDQVKAGATFARTGARDVVETAQVISVQEHAGGVAHVHYACRLQHASTVLENGPRTLALETFVERFRTPMSPARMPAKG